MLDRDEDMMITGTRHPYLFKYKIGFTNEGMLQALDIKVYANAGNTIDLSGPVSNFLGKNLTFKNKIWCNLIYR